MASCYRQGTLRDPWPYLVAGYQAHLGFTVTSSFGMVIDLPVPYYEYHYGNIKRRPRIAQTAPRRDFAGQAVLVCNSVQTQWAIPPTHGLASTRCAIIPDNPIVSIDQIKRLITHPLDSRFYRQVVSGRRRKAGVPLKSSRLP